MVEYLEVSLWVNVAFFFFSRFLNCRASVRGRPASLGSTVPDMGLVCGSKLRKWKLVNTANSSVSSVGSLL
uniref:60S ribosomal protein L37a isoform X1 n=1 Tax=Rhizophora mucronata TaxID=61149 RepID=A0A2P2K9Y5_RHIMU